MRSFAIIAAIASVVAAHGGEWSDKPKGTAAPVYVTDVVTAYTTYCPKPTEITHNGVTYTVTSATTLTISNCPCTVTRPVETPSAKATSAPYVAPVPSTGAPVVSKASSYFPSVAGPTSTAKATTSAPATYTGAASKAQVAGAGLLAVLGAAAVAL